MVSFPLIRIQSSVTYPDMLPPHKVRLNKKSTTLRLTMIFKQPLSLPVTLRIRLEAGIGQCTTATSGFLSLPEKAQSHPYHSSDDKYGHKRILYGEVYVYCKCHCFFFFFGDGSSGLPILRFELSFKTFIVISEIIRFNWDMNSPAL